MKCLLSGTGSAEKCVVLILILLNKKNRNLPWRKKHQTVNLYSKTKTTQDVC